MKRIIFGFVFWLLHCTSGTDMDSRNKDFFTDAAQNSWQYFSSTSANFDGNIQSLLPVINALANSSSTDSTIANTTIEGIVTIPSNYSLAMGNDPCSVNNNVFLRSFVIEDRNAGILVAYGFEPPDENPANASSMKYITNSRNSGMAVFGNRVRLTATRAIKYGSTTGTIPIITDFSNLTVISTRNSVPYTIPTSAYSITDQFRTRRLEGYVSIAPKYKECASPNARQFQFNYQQLYLGELCVGGTVSSCDAVQCTVCSGTKYNFQMSRDFGAGTLTGFDYGNAFSYNFATAVKVRFTGAVFTPLYNTTFAAGGALMLTQKPQVESIP